MTDSEEIKRLEAEIKDLDLDFMRGLISPKVYNKKAKKLITQLIEAGGKLTGIVTDLTPTQPEGKRALLDEVSKAPRELGRRLRSKLLREQAKMRRYTVEIEKLEEEIKQLEIDYVQGLVPVGTFIPKMVALKTKLTNQAHRSAQHSLAAAKDASTPHKTSKPQSRWRKVAINLVSATSRYSQRLSRTPQSQIIKKHSLILLVLILAIILRIPRVPHLEGYDGFVLVSDAYSLLDGYAATWLITPASYLGIFTFSGYPIGAIAVFAFFLALFGTLEVATFFYLTFFTGLLVLFSYLLMREIFDDKFVRSIAVLFYVLAPVTYEYTYNSPTARVPFLALLPLCILGFIKWCRCCYDSPCQ